MAQIHEDCLTSTMSNTVLACIPLQFSDIDFDNETIYIWQRLYVSNGSNFDI